jgi:hypothetical protein
MRQAGSKFCLVGWFIPVPKCTRNCALAVVIRLTKALQVDNVKYMSRFIFAALASISLTIPGAAQQVPGRDLLDFPLGLLAESAPLSSRMTGSLWNPATSMLSSTARAEFGFAGLTTPQEQGVRLEMLAGSYRVRPALTATISFAQASVSDILRTETDPQSLGGEIQYGTTLVSAGVATSRANVTAGAAARYRWASIDTKRSGVLALDVGAIVDRVAGTPVRLALSTFLLTASRSKEAPTYLAAADAPLIRRDSSFVLRGGYSFSRTDGRGREDYAFTTSSYRQFDASAGVVETSVFGNRDRRWRLGVGVRYAGYTAAIGRESGAVGVGGSYQFLLTRVIR